MKLENLDLAVISDSKSDDDDVNVAVAELPIVSTAAGSTTSEEIPPGMLNMTAEDDTDTRPGMLDY